MQKFLFSFERAKVLLEKNRVGVDDIEGPPVPIPNTEVKLNGAEDTWLVTAWENREMPTFIFYIRINKLRCMVCLENRIFILCCIFKKFLKIRV